MSRVVSVHEYKLKPGVNALAFESAYRKAKADGLFNLPGLVESYLVRGIKGKRRGAYAAIWVYASQEMWERNWGAVGSPVKPGDYPTSWLTWENEILGNWSLGGTGGFDAEFLKDGRGTFMTSHIIYECDPESDQLVITINGNSEPYNVGFDDGNLWMVFGGYIPSGMGEALIFERLP